MPLYRHESLIILPPLERALDAASDQLVHPYQHVMHEVVGDAFELYFERPDFLLSFRARFKPQIAPEGYSHYHGDPQFRFEFILKVKEWDNYVGPLPDEYSNLFDVIDPTLSFTSRGEVQLPVEPRTTMYDFILQVTSTLCVRIAQTNYNLDHVSPLMRMSWLLMALRALKHSEARLGQNVFDDWIAASHRKHNAHVKHVHDSRCPGFPLRIEYRKWCHKVMTTYLLHPQRGLC